MPPPGILADRGLHPILFDLDRGELVLARAPCAHSDGTVHTDGGSRLPLRKTHLTEHHRVPLADILPRVPTAADELRHHPLHFIFMTDFCGSTLLANSLANLPAFGVCYSELELFKRLALARRLFDAECAIDRHGWPRLLDVGLALIARHEAPQRRTLVKEQPVTNYILDQLMESTVNWRSIFLYSPLEDYLLAVLKSDWRRPYARDRVAIYIETQVIPATANIDKTRLSDAQTAALHWLVQMYTYCDIPAPVRAHRLRALNGLQLIHRPAETLYAVCSYLGAPANDEDIARVVASDVFSRHSKDTDRAYSKAARDDELRHLRARYRDELLDGLHWAEHILERTPLELPPTPSLSRGS